MKPNTSVVYIVVGSLALAMLAGMYSTHTLIMAKADAALIAIMSGFSGTALGLLGSILSRTGAAPDPQHTNETKLVTEDNQPISKNNPLPTDPQ